MPFASKIQIELAALSPMYEYMITLLVRCSFKVNATYPLEKECATVNWTEGEYNFTGEGLVGRGSGFGRIRYRPSQSARQQP